MTQILNGQDLKSPIFRLLRGTTYIVLFRVAAMALGISSIAILTRALSPGDLGVYFILLQIGNFCTLFCKLGTDQGNQLFLSKAIVNEPECVYEIFRQLRKILLWASIVTLVALLAIWKFLDNVVLHTNHPFMIYLFQASIIIILTYEQMQSSALRALDMLLKSSLSEKCIQSFIFVILLLPFFMLMPDRLTLDIVLLLYCIGGLWAILISYVWTKMALQPYRKQSEGESGIGIKEIFRVSLPMGMAAGLGMLRTSMDILIIGWLLGPAAAGLYAPIQRIVNLVVFLLQAINKMLSPVIATLSTLNDRKAIEELVRKSAAISSYVSVPLALGMIVLGEPFLYYIFGPRFASLAPVLSVLLVGHMVRSIMGSPDIVLQMMGKEVAFMNNNVVVTILTLGLMLLVAKPLGLLGISLVSSSTLIAQYIFLSLIVYKYLGIKTYMNYITVKEIKVLVKENISSIMKI